MGETQPQRKRRRTSLVWEYFSPIADESGATCNTCLRVIKTTRSGTSGLLRHMMTVHGVNVRDASINASAINSDPLEIISKLAAMDGDSFKRIAHSVPLRQLYEAATNNRLPNSPNSIRDAVLKYFQRAKLKIIEEIKDHKINGQKFSVTLDEWTSLSQRRYMNVNVHTGTNFWNLGLKRITGTFTSEACLDLFTQKLGEFEINLADILAVVTDGASVMKKFGRLSTKCHQLCLAHGIHLAVTDVLYKKRREQPNYMDSSEEVFESQITPIEEDEFLDEDFESYFQNQDEEEIEYVESLTAIISKVRKIVTEFRRSPKKMELLKKNENADRGLIMDSKTRWNSLHLMLKRFFDLKESLLKTYIDLKENFPVSEETFETIKSVVDVLESVKVAAELICQRDATLIDADVAFKFLLESLLNQDTPLALEMFEAIKLRYRERRSILFAVCGYLHYGRVNFPADDGDFFEKFSRQELTAKVKNIFESLSEESSEENFAMDEDDEESTEPSQSLLGLSQKTKLAEAIKLARNFNPRPNNNLSTQRCSFQTIRREMQIYESTGKKGNILSNVYQWLMTIPPSSVEAERVFSSSNNFCSKTRSRLGDECLNALVFLKSYFQNM